MSISGSHPLIVGLDYAFQNDYRLYLIMEYCPGGDLA
jgi:serine/threonine protein kinase